MDYSQALTEIKKGLVRPVYLLHGEETFLARRLEKAIVEAVLPDEDRDMSLTVLERDPQPAALVGIIETVPFLGGKNVIILRGTGFFRAGKKDGEDEADSQDKADDRLLKLMADMPEYSHVVFSAGEKADKRRKLFKAVEQYGAVVDLSPLKPKDVRPWITAKLTELGRKMAPDAMEQLLAAVSMMPQVSLGFLSGELDKTALYAAGQTITRRDVMAVMAAVPEVSVFTMIEAVSLKQTARALKLLDEQLSGGESALRLLALLARQVSMLWRG
jgi:DNA polymerase-3 subunit delta